MFEPKHTKTIIGIIGGGQLGGFLVQHPPSHAYVEYHIYSPDDPIFPSEIIKTYDNNLDPPDREKPQIKHTYGDYSHTQKIVEFGKQCDIITYELENISIEALEILQSEHHKKIFPDPQILKIIQNKKTQKQWLLNHDYPTPNFLHSSLPTQFPCIQKHATGGYDGRGVQIVQNAAHLASLVTNIETFNEEMISIEKELSIIIGRNQNRETYLFDPVETIPNNEHQLDHLICPAKIPSRIAKEMETIAQKLAHDLDLVGIMAIEFFLSSSGKLLVNEMSPRPHNTGHHTIDYYQMNQYNLLNRCLLNLSLKLDSDNQRFDPTQDSVIMVNIFGRITAELDQPNKIKPTFFYRNDGDQHIYCYNKETSYPNRKLGHITFLQSDPECISDQIIRNKHTISYVCSQVIKNSSEPIVSIIMGSSSDLSIMEQASEILDAFQIPYEFEIISAHRSPKDMFTFAELAKSRGIKVIIAGAGGAAHLPGMVASITTLPVIGIPIKSSNSIQGIDSLLSICQMPNGIPVATMAINGAKNGGLMAVRMLAMNDDKLSKLMGMYQEHLSDKVDKMNESLYPY